MYHRWFNFRPQLSTFPFLFLLHPQITKIFIAEADEARRDLLIDDVNYANINDCTSQDDFCNTPCT
jgi:hypothetical protein